jgi:hypothetical protein
MDFPVRRGILQGFIRPEGFKRRYILFINAVRHSPSKNVRDFQPEITSISRLSDG